MVCFCCLQKPLNMKLMIQSGCSRCINVMPSGVNLIRLYDVGNRFVLR